ncbi:hypothetical protein OL548_08260 [Lysinibacillus sp. MHQ-1]|nr:hypothetical protein OL548_08260 [Lysinibacillus sp. MHQ-1]
MIVQNLIFFNPQDGRLGDKIFDIGQHCALTEEAELAIEEVRACYKEAMQDAMGYSKRYAEAEYTVRRLLDNCLSASLWREKNSVIIRKINKII